MTTLKEELQTCLEAFRRGELTEAHLRRALDSAEKAGDNGNGHRTQDLLYLQANSTSLGATVLGMAMLRDGQLSDGPADPQLWPYVTVLDAIRDGWRVIHFPNMALMMDESRTYGLGCEFILEK